MTTTPRGTYWVRYTRNGETKLRGFHATQGWVYDLCERWDRDGFTDEGTVTIFADTRAELVAR